MPVSHLIMSLSVMLGTLSSHGGAREADSLRALLPNQADLARLVASDSARVYRGEELYTYIDGGADLFFEYGFRQALVARYEGAGTIDLEIYEMKDPDAAWGIYSVRSALNATPADLGDEGVARSDYVMFRKGRYYVTISSSDTTQESRDALAALGRAVGRNINDRGSRPNLVAMLPKTGIVKQRYMRGFLGVSLVYQFDIADIFHSEESAAGIYGDHTLILFRYPTATEARNRFTQVNGSLHSGGRYHGSRTTGEMLVLEDRSNVTLCFACAGSSIVVSISPDAAIAETSCAAAVASIEH